MNNLSALIIQRLPNGKNSSLVFTDLGLALDAFGRMLSFDMLLLTIFLGVSIAGVIGNLFSVFIFYRPAFYSANSPPLFSYMRYEAMIGVVGNLAETIYAMASCPYTLDMVNNYPVQWIQGYIAIPVYNITYYAKFLIEIAIVVDRILMLAPTLGSRWGLSHMLKIKRPYIVFVGIIAFSILINYPYLYLMFAPISFFTLVNYGYPGYQVFTYFGVYKVAWSAWGNPGYYVMMFVFIFKNGLTFLIETVLNAVSLVLFKRHLSNKVTLGGGGGSLLRPIGAASQRHVEKKDHASHASVGGRNMAMLVLVNSVTGFVHNVLLLAFTLSYLIGTQSIILSRVLNFSAYFSSTVRHAVNFLQFYLFNTYFRKEANIFFAKIKFSRSTSRVRTSSPTIEQHSNSTLPPQRAL
jgi:hypothetical protein